MTLSEFKAWFKGFSEIMEGPPNEDQWKRIKARVAKINGEKTSYPIFIDHYVSPYRRYWHDDGVRWLSGSSPIDAYSTKTIGASTTFNPLDEMMPAGRAEYQSMLAS